jgi:hypothetical protein
VFHVETLADLEKEVAAGNTPESVVGMLAAKTPSEAYPTVHHHSLVSAELLGEEIEMRSRVMVVGGDVMKAPDGTIGLHIDRVSRGRRTASLEEPRVFRDRAGDR